MGIRDMPSPVAEAFQAYNDHEPETLIADFADGATFYDPVRPDGISRTEYRDYCADLFVAFPDTHWEVEQYVASTGRQIAVEWTYRGTFSGAIEGIPPTGESFAFPGSSIINVEDGQIVYWRDYWDQRQFFEQVGLTFPAVVSHLPTLVAGKVSELL